MINPNQFTAPWWARNKHIQTLLPTFLRRNKRLKLAWQKLDLADGDFVDLAWIESVEAPSSNQPIMVVFHGLEGSVESPYAKGILQACQQQGWRAVVMHFRGCSGKPNNLWRGYHSGEIKDATSCINYLHQQYPEAPLLALGYSLGGNMLVNYLAKTPDSPLAAAAVVSPPLNLGACSERLQRGFSKVYQHHLLSRMKRNLCKKIERTQQAPLNTQEVQTWRNFVQFDEHYTAKAHGFKGAADYYHRCSGLPLLKEITQPTLLIHAADDPFMDQRVIPKADQLSQAVEYRLSNTGGHVGFVGGSLLRPQFWLESTIPAWFKQQLEQTSK
ncbi:hydrolase [Agarivorans sp. B2Z047]|uniref:hydrolase n=1 Tax=Agarivorans sp. B2Z047 TaxID=2652721 RepID=UPI001406972B|nr:hydrolase [Agarivorans sp. B2Z047]MPW30088.1 hydrolase [Agarivorans sp. B2Z047]UQN45224.1 hydrolase [Agarivorans sp. B2Z047]